LKLEFSVVPSELRVPNVAMASSAASKPYSIAVAPRRARQNPLTKRKQRNMTASHQIASGLSLRMASMATLVAEKSNWFLRVLS
jgi:hypothetical protein